ncbi:uncharacterized protein G2W53_031448 [Senna tora]|uniref:Uncharacterized protein n=1 Tax=Senna tora TaxID=362788 RepID=A0A834T8K8_9FABA|nr:uncharacterized protein G2W53_031448 [Senna tora]
MDETLQDAQAPNLSPQALHSQLQSKEPISLRAAQVPCPSLPQPPFPNLPPLPSLTSPRNLNRRTPKTTNLSLGSLSAASASSVPNQLLERFHPVQLLLTLSLMELLEMLLEVEISFTLPAANPTDVRLGRRNHSFTLQNTCRQRRRSAVPPVSMPWRPDMAAREELRRSRLWLAIGVKANLEEGIWVRMQAILCS